MLCSRLSRMMFACFLFLLLGAGCAHDEIAPTNPSHPTLFQTERSLFPPNLRYRGLSYSEWEARWWQAALSIPIVDGHHPFISGGAFGAEDGVLFLAGVGGGVTVDLTIPAGNVIFFPVVNAECSVIEPPPFHGDNEEELRACANYHIDNTSQRFAVIDGVPVTNLDDYRSESPLFEFGPLPENNIAGLPAGTTSSSVDAGVYLFLALPVGKHVLHFGGTFDLFGFSIDTTYNITVVSIKGGGKGSTFN